MGGKLKMFMNWIKMAITITKTSGIFQFLLKCAKVVEYH